MLGEIEAVEENRIVVADMEAGLGTLSRLENNLVDYVLVVAEQSEKSVEVARRAVTMAHERNLGEVIVLANRIRDTTHLAKVKDIFSREEIIVIPYDDRIEDADRAGRAPIDTAPDSPGVQALESVAQRLLNLVAE